MEVELADLYGVKRATAREVLLELATGLATVLLLGYWLATSTRRWRSPRPNCARRR